MIGWAALSEAGFLMIYQSATPGQYQPEHPAFDLREIVIEPI
jgi:hypothetical protein